MTETSPKLPSANNPVRGADRRRDSSGLNEKPSSSMLNSVNKYLEEPENRGYIRIANRGAVQTVVAKLRQRKAPLQ